MGKSSLLECPRRRRDQRGLGPPPDDVLAGRLGPGARRSGARAAPRLARDRPADVRRNEDPSSGAVAIVDLPDLDSIDVGHRARVDAALPRVDAVVWVTDPEKYHDALLHDDLLLRWLPRLERQLVVVNKADRLTADEASAVDGT